MKISIKFFVLLCSLTVASATWAIPQKAINVNPVEVGSEAPDAAIHTAEGKRAQLSGVIDGQPAVLIFYRGGWCPYCTRQLEGLIDVTGDLEQLGVQIIALSPDNPDNTAAAARESNLPYTLLSDAEANAAKAYGVAFKVDSAGYERLMGFGIDLEAASGQTHHLLPVPAVFLIDGSGVIQFRHFDPDYRKRLAPGDLLKAAKAVSAGS
jgi:peroxiredoxin